MIAVVVMGCAGQINTQEPAGAEVGDTTAVQHCGYGACTQVVYCDHEPMYPEGHCTMVTEFAGASPHLCR